MDYLAQRMNAIDASGIRKVFDLAGQLDRPEQAVKWLERALALDEMAYLDPDSQLTDARRAELGARLQALRRLDRSPTESVD